MSFTDRFIRLPIQVYDSKKKELTGKEDLEDSFMKINPLDIASYRPTFSGDDDSEMNATAITSKAGETTTICMSIEEFENLVNSFVK